jgi:hypothetical protein
MSHISESALLQRIRRCLAHQGSRIIRARSASMILEYGPYYVVDDRNCIQDWCISDLEAYGRDLGVIPGAVTMTVT